MIHINDIKLRENTEYFLYQVSMVIERGEVFYKRNICSPRQGNILLLRGQDHK